MQTQRLTRLVSIAIAPMLWACTAAAQPPVPTPRPPERQTVPVIPLECNQADAIAKHLGDRYGEIAVAIGFQNNNRVLEVFVSESTRTWTIVVHNPDGISCIVAAGTYWEREPQGNPT